MRYIDERYIKLISSQLKRFKQKGNDVYNMRCPFCGDSKKKENKTRGYLFHVQNVFIFKCHNCTRTTNLGGLIKHLNMPLYRQYILETFANQKVYIHNEIPQRHIHNSHGRDLSNNNVQDILLDSILNLPSDHYAVAYIRNRKIPEERWDELFYSPSFRDFVLSMKPDEKKELYEVDPRIVIPMYDENHILQGFQGRALNTSVAKYIAIKISDDAMKMFGLHRVDKTQKIYVFEGPIDSFFLPNAVATGDSDLLRSAKYLSQDQLVLVYDNQYTNKDLRKLLNKAIDAKFKVCIFPKHIKHKDINEMIMAGTSQFEVKALIDNNTFYGLRAKVELDLR